MEELQSWYQLGAGMVVPSPAVCSGSVLLSLVTALWQWICWSHRLAIIFSSIFVIAGRIPAVSLEPTARQGTVVQLREAPVPYSAEHQVLVQAVIARKTLIPNASVPRTKVL